MKIKDIFENTPIQGETVFSIMDFSKLNLKSLKGCPQDFKNESFKCSANPELESLEGCPQINIKHFYANYCNLKSLKGAPKKINGTFSCFGNKHLKSLEGMPKEGVEKVIVSNCDLTSLEGMPNRINGDFECDTNYNLTSLKGVSQEGVWDFDCRNCHLTSLEGAPKKINGNLYTDKNPITTLKGIHKIFEEINGVFYFPEEVQSNILGLLKIKNLQQVSFFSENGAKKGDIAKIINSYLPNPTPDQIIDCQNELIDAGFEEYAEL